MAIQRFSGKRAIEQARRSASVAREKARSSLEEQNQRQLVGVFTAAGGGALVPLAKAAAVKMGAKSPNPGGIPMGALVSAALTVGSVAARGAKMEVLSDHLAYAGMGAMGTAGESLATRFMLAMAQSDDDATVSGIALEDDYESYEE